MKAAGFMDGCKTLTYTKRGGCQGSVSAVRTGLQNSGKICVGKME
jgi:hypothetical protein